LTESAELAGNKSFTLKLLLQIFWHRLFVLYTDILWFYNLLALVFSALYLITMGFVLLWNSPLSHFSFFRSRKRSDIDLQRRV
jgi:uncharacterized membrane protein YeiB